MASQAIQNQIALAEDLKRYLHGFQERLSTAGQSYKNKSSSLYEAGMFDEFQKKFEQEFVQQTTQSISQVVERINDCDIPFIERYIAKLEDTLSVL